MNDTKRSTHSNKKMKQKMTSKTRDSVKSTSLPPSHQKLHTLGERERERGSGGNAAHSMPKVPPSSMAKLSFS